MRLTVALAVGIGLGKFVSLNPLFFIVFLFFLTGLLIHFNQKFSFRLNSVFGAGVHLIFIGIGFTLYTVFNQKPMFYTQAKFSAEVLEILQEKPNSYQSVLNIKAVYRNDSLFVPNEKVMVYFEKTERAETLQPGEIILFDQNPQPIQNAKNPYEFDYAGYLARKKIYRQVYLPEDRWQKTDAHAGFSVFIFAEKIRSRLLQIYSEHNLSQTEFQVLSALTLGYKRGLDPEIKQTFSSAGAMHVLAVSGLHVGIVFIVLNFLLGFLRKQKTGRMIFILTVVLVLWCFAFITGLSPSVQRAATMFSFIVVGNNIKRQSNIYNSLAASAFLLLILNPNNLFEAGFQLSYSAVFGIVFLQPRLVNIFHFKYKLFQYFWELLTVSVAAQVATFPATAFYFNQFPSYFWLANLLVIPAVMALIPLGLGLLAFHWVPLLSVGIFSAVKGLLFLLINFLRFIEKLPFAVAEFTLSVAGLIFLATALLAVLLFMETQKKKYFKAALISLALMAGNSFAIELVNLFRKEIIIYNQPDNVLVHLISGKRNYVFSAEKLNEADFGLNAVKNTVRKLRLKEPVFLDFNQDYVDRFLFLKNGLIVFDDKLISYKFSNDKFPETLYPELLIDPLPGKVAMESNLANQTIISSSRYTRDFMFEKPNVFHLRKQGAFREKW